MTTTTKPDFHPKSDCIFTMGQGELLEEYAHILTKIATMTEKGMRRTLRRARDLIEQISPNMSEGDTLYYTVAAYDSAYHQQADKARRSN